jgi:hypothetical protein
MTQRPNAEELKRIWQNQPQEKARMSLEQIRGKALRLQRLRRLVGWTMLPVFGLCTLFFVGILVRAVSGRPLWIVAYGTTFVGRFLWIAIDRLPLVPIGVGIYLIHFSISSFVRAKTLAADAGLQTSVSAYRAYFEWERSVQRRVLGVFAVSMAFIGLDAAGLWMRVSPFPVQEALRLGAGWALTGILLYITRRHHQLKLAREFRLLDELEAEGNTSGVYRRG